MAALTGKGGEIRYGAKAIFRLNHWDLNIDTNIHDVTAWTTSAAAWRTNIAGLSGANATISGHWDMIGDTSGQKGKLQTNMLTPTTAQLILYVDGAGGENYRGSVLLSGMAVSADIDGTIDATWNATFTGAVSYSTAT